MKMLALLAVLFVGCASAHIGGPTLHPAGPTDAFYLDTIKSAPGRFDANVYLTPSDPSVALEAQTDHIEEIAITLRDRDAGSAVFVFDVTVLNGEKIVADYRVLTHAERVAFPIDSVATAVRVSVGLWAGEPVNGDLTVEVW